AADQQLIDRSIAEIGFESDRREIGYASLIQAELLRFVALCLRATQRAHGFQRHFRHTAWRHRLIGERAAALIREHATRQPELTLGEAARLCATSPNHLNRIFKAQTGSTFHHALLCHRLQCARELLEKGRLNCTEAAFESGFNDSNYFSRAFKKEFGYPPSAIR
ncbi:MAG: helix-turn-helix transcriptional regulator, partial [Verrucomicrobiota bacterium]